MHGYIHVMCCIHLYVLYKLFERKKKFPRPTDRDSVTGGTRNKELILDGLTYLF